MESYEYFSSSKVRPDLMPKGGGVKQKGFFHKHRAVMSLCTLNMSTVWQAPGDDLPLAQSAQDRPNGLEEELSTEELTYSDAGVLFALM